MLLSWNCPLVISAVRCTVFFFRKGESTIFPTYIFPRRCCGFEVSQVCADITLALAGREMLISAEEEEGVLPAPDPDGCLKLRVTCETSRMHRSELYFSKLQISEWVRWQTRMKNYFLILILADVASFMYIYIYIFQWFLSPSPQLTTFGGILYPGRYLTFSCSWLIISESFLPLTISSNTHILTVGSNLLDFWTFLPMILAMADPLGKKKIKITNRKQIVLLWIGNTNYFKYNNS